MSVVQTDPPRIGADVAPWGVSTRLQLDVSYMLIRALEVVGLAWDVRRPSPVQLASKRLATAS